MTAEEQLKTAALEFYQALDDLLLGKGTQAMSEIWHHDEHVTTVHPFGHWARGWNEVRATWEEIAAVFSFYRGHAERSDGIGTLHDMRVSVLGEVGYVIGVYKSHLYLLDGEDGLSVNCTDIFHRRDGVWKIVHHHPDQAPPEFQASLARMVESGSG